MQYWSKQFIIRVRLTQRATEELAAYATEQGSSDYSISQVTQQGNISQGKSQ